MSLKGYLRSKITTKLEKRLIFTVAILCFVLLVLFVIVLTQGKNVCDNPDCIRTAVHILDTVNRSVNPCDDFYNYSCGTFLRHAFVSGKFHSLYTQTELTKNQFKEIVMSDEDERNTTRMVAWQRKFYRSCSNSTKAKLENGKVLERLLDEIIGGWPLIKSYWTADQFEWQGAMVRARRAGLYNWFFLKITIPHERIKGKKVLWISPPDDCEVDSFLWSKENVRAMEDIAKYLGPTSITVTSEFTKTLEFAKAFNETIQTHYKRIYANSTQSPGQQSDLNKTMAIKDIRHPYIKLDWLSFLRNLTNLPLKGNDLIAFDVYDYLEDFYYLLLKTPKRFLANYIGWTIIMTNIHYLSDEIRNRYLEMRKASIDEEITIDRKEMCYTLSTKIFKHVVETEYIRRYTTPIKIKYVKKMIRYIKEELENTIRRTAWIETKSKEDTIKHVRNMSEAIGWTDDAFDVRKFEKNFNYDKIRFSNDNAIDMARALSKTGMDTYFQHLFKNTSELEEAILIPRVAVNAYFAVNTLYLPAPLLQGLIFNENRPAYINYGALGSIIGHEFTHGILSYVGTKSEEYFTSNETMDKFHTASMCIVDEYDKFKYIRDEFNKNGSHTFDENAADYLGVNLAYRAYQNWVYRNGKENKLPGIDLTPNQMFWVMASTYMCHQPGVSREDRPLSIARHGAPNFRVIGRLRNSPHFAEDFGCPAGSPMNPKEKCVLYV